jgi:hypothetical protein
MPCGERSTWYGISRRTRTQVSAHAAAVRTSWARLRWIGDRLTASSQVGCLRRTATFEILRSAPKLEHRQRVDHVRLVPASNRGAVQLDRVQPNEGVSS